jgi:hypothetical protein
MPSIPARHPARDLTRHLAPLLAYLALQVAPLAYAEEVLDCRPFDGFGFSTIGIPHDDGGLAIEWQLLAAPTYPLPLQPILFLDGIVHEALAPIELDCGETFTLRLDPEQVAALRHVAHVTVIPHPPVPAAFAALTPQEAFLRYAAAFPPDVDPWADVERYAPDHGLPWPLDRTPIPADPAHPPIWPTRFPDGSLLPDGVSFDGNVNRRLTRARVGEVIDFEITFDPSPASAGSVAITCLLDDRQIAAFDGALVTLRMLRYGEPLRLPAQLTLDRAGWQRLQCMMLSDEGVFGPYVWPRPLWAGYVWGEP